ncbi:MAG: glucosamine-6-phosphate deaminase [Synergistaceae bacterium]|jgi:glucosamine-6-phosphate deaminase|nr:glucosamine-6-phosphate deaminase [Synergistaceae bacterium]
MRIVTVDTNKFAETAADMVEEHILSDSPGVVGFATGTTTPPVYELLTRRFEKRDMPGLVVFNVDEYLGVPPDNPKTCLSRMKTQLYDFIRPGREICFRSNAPDPKEDVRRVLREIGETGGLRLQILGIGKDGHIGFNDPGTPWEMEAAVISFSASSRADKAAFWGGIDKVPAQGATLGVKGIMNARSLLLLARGESKAEIVRAALQGPITPEVPASALQLHPFATVVLDRPAASGLKIEGCRIH